MTSQLMVTKYIDNWINYLRKIANFLRKKNSLLAAAFGIRLKLLIEYE